jgi:hypothetical protein
LGARHRYKLKNKTKPESSKKTKNPMQNKMIMAVEIL